MKRKITISKSDTRTINGRLTIPINLLQGIGITEEEREVTINLENNKLIIEKVRNGRIEVGDNESLKITQDEMDYLLR